MQNETPEVLRYRHLYDGHGWHRDAALELDGAGHVRRLRPAREGDPPAFAGLALPGMPNLHSHAFQRVIAGLTEQRGPGGDSFWSWRRLMYAAAERLTSDEFRLIVRQAYLEMLEAGYTAVAEFHYLHRPGTISDPIETVTCLREEAAAVGMPVTLLPVLYERAGFDADEPAPGQARFALDPDAYLALLSSAAAASESGWRVGVAFHSLRATKETSLRAVLAAAPANVPVHIHVAEQPAEVADCLRVHGRRPVAWLLDECAVDERWCLVHATHIGPAECRRLAERRAVAGLCPTTEANLGDGLFPLDAHVAAGGRYGVGSDSHVTIDPFDEVRWLEYGQRLRTGARAVLGDEARRHSGLAAWQSCVTGGAQALGQPLGGLRPGQRADLVVLDPPPPGISPGAAVDQAIFASGARRIREVRVAGRRLVVDGRHVARGDERERLAAVIQRLVA